MTDFLDFGASLIADFQTMSVAQQKETLTLAANARFVLRMIPFNSHFNAVDQATQAIRSALVRGIPTLGGEALPSWPGSFDVADDKSR